MLLSDAESNIAGCTIPQVTCEPRAVGDLDKTVDTSRVLRRGWSSCSKREGYATGIGDIASIIQYLFALRV